MKAWSVALLMSLTPMAALAAPLPVAAQHYRTGYELMKAQNYRSAADEFEQATVIDSTYGEAYYSLGQAYRVLNEYAKAIRALERARQLGVFPDRVPGEMAQLYQKQGLKLLQQRLYPDAIAAFEKGLGIEPNNAEALFGIGLAQDRLRNLDAARKAYERTVAIDPRNAKARAALGDIDLRNREYLSAIKEFEQAIAADSSYLEGYGGLARVQMETEEFEAAVATLRDALARDPRYANGQLYLGVALTRLSRWSEAVDPLQKAAALDPKNADAHFRLAEAYYGKGDYRLAIEAARQALQRKPDHHAAKVVVADANAKLGQVAEARVWYNRAIKDSRFRDYCARRLEELSRPGKPE